MDADTALSRINEELLLNGHAPVILTEPQRLQAFASLRAYASASGRPLEVAVKDIVRFQIQSEDLALRRQQ